MQHSVPFAIPLHRSISQHRLRRDRSAWLLDRYSVCVRGGVGGWVHFTKGVAECKRLIIIRMLAQRIVIFLCFVIDSGWACLLLLCTYIRTFIIPSISPHFSSFSLSHSLVYEPPATSTCVCPAGAGMGGLLGYMFGRGTGGGGYYRRPPHYGWNVGGGGGSGWGSAPRSSWSSGSGGSHTTSG